MHCLHNLLSFFCEIKTTYLLQGVTVWELRNSIAQVFPSHKKDAIVSVAHFETSGLWVRESCRFRDCSKGFCGIASPSVAASCSHFDQQEADTKNPPFLEHSGIAQLTSILYQR